MAFFCCVCNNLGSQLFNGNGVTVNPQLSELLWSLADTSLVPRLFCVGGEKEPGIHCLRMRQIAPEFRRDWELSFTFAIRAYVGLRHLAKAKLRLVRRSPVIN